MLRRSESKIWLVGPYSPELTGSKLPSQREVLAVFMHHHIIMKKTVKESATSLAREIMAFWEIARIPTQRVDKISEKCKQLFLKWAGLKKNKENKAKRSDKLVEKENNFNEMLDNLFDIAHKNAMALIKIEEDRQFLIAQRKKGRLGKMGAIDRQLLRKEKRKIERFSKSQSYASKVRKETEQQLVAEIPEYFDDSSNTSQTSSLSSDDDDEYLPPRESAKASPSTEELYPVCEKPKHVMTSGLAAAFDRTKTSDRNATYVLAETIQSVGHSSNTVVLSRQTVRRKRMEFRKKFATDLKDAFKADVPLTIHWDGKMMTDISGKDVVDRLPIIVSGLGVDQLLCVPKLPSSTGENMAASVYKAIQEWGVMENVKCICFDTTNSNTGLRKGACTLIEQKLDRPLLYFACRHHILEILLESVFSKCFGSSSGPEIQLFKRFQANWKYIIRNEFDVEDLEIPAETKQDVKSFCTSCLQVFQPRDDYKEFLELAIITLGGMPRPESVPGHGYYRFIAPGALHRARWMAKAIYSLKISFFRHQFKLSAKEASAVKAFNLFVIQYYVKAWFLSQNVVCAPRLDLEMLKKLDDAGKVYKPALHKLTNHLWYLSEELVALSLYDPEVPLPQKRKIVEAMNQREAQGEPLKRCNIHLENIQGKELHDFATKNTYRFFEILDIDSCFLQKDPEQWTELDSYNKSLGIVHNLRATNDTAERGVALIQEYNNLQTKDEDMKQYLLQFVQDHRKKFPTCNKKALLQAKS